jgi:hypothetical protein
MDGVVFKHNRVWHSIVARGIKMPAHMCDVKDAKDQIWHDLLAWNAISQSDIESIQLLCQPDDIWTKERKSLMISFEAKEDYERVI